MQKTPHTIHYRITPTSPVQAQTVMAYSTEHAHLIIKHENDITHNQIEFLESQTSKETKKERSQREEKAHDEVLLLNTIINPYGIPFEN
jgi:predicted transcriptional regulator